jgi:hypothetical protein
VTTADENENFRSKNISISKGESPGPPSYVKIYF